MCVMDKQLYTTNEAADLLGVTPARVRQMVSRNEIESEKLGRDRFITAEAIAEAQQRKTKPGPVPREKAEQTAQKLNQAFRKAAEDEQQAEKKKGGKR